MARKSKLNDNLSDAGTSSVTNRKQSEAERQADARAARAAIVKQTKADLKATADRLAAKPTDSRKLVS